MYLIALISAEGAGGFAVPKLSVERSVALRMAAGEFGHILGEGTALIRVRLRRDAIILTSSVAADAPAASSDEQFFGAQESIKGIG